MKKSLLLVLLILPNIVIAQLPKVGANKYEFLRLIRASDAYYDSTVFDEKDIEGNEITRVYKATSFSFFGLNGCLTVAFDCKGKAITERWVLTEDWQDESMIPYQYLKPCSDKGTIARVTMLRDSILAVFGKPKKSEKTSEFYIYEWKNKPVHRLSLMEGRIAYFYFSK